MMVKLRLVIRVSYEASLGLVREAILNHKRSFLDNAQAMRKGASPASPKLLKGCNGQTLIDSKGWVCLRGSKVLAPPSPMSLLLPLLTQPAPRLQTIHSLQIPNSQKFSFLYKNESLRALIPSAVHVITVFTCHY